MTLKFSSFMANVNPNIKNETKSDIYIFKPDAIFISMISKIEVSQFYD